MIDLENKRIIDQDGYASAISFEVWFQTPLGLTKSLDMAVQRVKENDFPILIIRPVVVAVAVGGDYYEIIAS